MNELNLEQVRAAMFTDPGVKAVDDLRLVAGEHGRAIAATITVAAPSVDLDLVHAVIAQVLADQFGIDQIMLCFNDPPGTAAAHRGAVKEDVIAAPGSMRLRWQAHRADDPATRTRRHTQRPRFAAPG